ncbi:DUF802 domain-containing protein [Luteimonas sp. Sa2BVA3]|uniref:DUF802 domain-containing protein n=1 Tax=Luteimonas colneyensis TaxID=2762230 RepID=A0ABR8UM42_9GAMM|nr:DUF802 domain-containing protein [Luteimonas colneyensis]MBD7988873.1 DUF802 domain-containing protein [Luteimonas colneyensis]
MNRTLPNALVFALGLLAVCWIGAGYVGSHALALAVTVLIGVLYVLGGLELHRYRRATAGLVSALDAPPGPEGLAAWLGGLDPGLRGAVRQRIDSGQGPLPAPALTPYLVGLLVLLGMLGTLLGMLVTLRGTGMALQSANDLQAVRDSLAAPVEGLGVAFGTSIAGVAASAMLGLLAALCRRERAGAVRLLDAAATGVEGLHVHTRAYQRDQALRLAQAQAEAMPALVDRLDALALALERQAQAAHAHQAAQQETFHAGTTAAWQQLAGTLGAALERSAADSARATAEAVQPAVAAAMEALAREGERTHAAVAESVERQLAALDAGFRASADASTTLWRQALEQQAGSQQALAQSLRSGLDAAGERFAERTGDLVEAVSSRLEATTLQVGSAWDEALARQQAQHEALAERHRQAFDAAGEAFDGRSAALLAGLEDTHARLQSTLAGQDAARLAAWQGGLEAIAAATIAEISTLVEAASEAPRAAAEVVAELRQKLSDSMARDTAMLDERTRLMDTLSTLLDAVNHASSEQRGAIDALVSTTSTLLEQAGARFGERVDAGTGAIEAAVARVDAGATGVAALGEALAGAVQQFGERNAELAERLEGIGAALEAAGTRGDEQLAYYVAQARELVDLSVLAQKQIIGELRQLPAAAGTGA